MPCVTHCSSRFSPCSRSPSRRAPRLGASPRAVVYSKSTTVESDAKGGLFAVRGGHLNQITETRRHRTGFLRRRADDRLRPRRGLFSVRADGSGQRQLTSGAELDSAPIVSPDGKRVVFERRASAGAPADLYSVRVPGGGRDALDQRFGRRSRSAFSPDGKTIVFVRDAAIPPTTEDLYSILPSGDRLARLTRPTESTSSSPATSPAASSSAAARAAKGRRPTPTSTRCAATAAKLQALVAGVGSAYVEDVSPDGHTLLFRRDQGLWSKRIGPGRARKLAQLPDGSRDQRRLLLRRPQGRRLRRGRRPAVAGRDRRREPPSEPAGGRLRGLRKRRHRASVR